MENQDMPETQCRRTVTLVSLPLEIISNILSFMPTWHLQLRMGQEVLSNDQLYSEYAVEVPGAPWNPTLHSQYPGTSLLLVCRYFRDAVGLLRYRNFFTGHALITPDYEFLENATKTSFLSMVTNLTLFPQYFPDFLDKKLYSRMTSLKNVTFVVDDTEELSPQCSTTSCRSVRLADVPKLSKMLDGRSGINVSNEIFHPGGELALCRDCLEDWTSDMIDSCMNIFGDDPEVEQEFYEVRARLKLEAPHPRPIEYITKLLFVIPFTDFYVQYVSRFLPRRLSLSSHNLMGDIVHKL